VREHAQFLDSILAQPDDVTLRNVYADWLEERGDPKAELVRLEWSLYAQPQPKIDLPRQRRNRARRRLVLQLLKLRSKCDPAWAYQFDRANWLRLLAGVKVHLDEGHERVVPSVRAIDKACDRYEEDTGFRLPISYRAYLGVFGLGDMGAAVYTLGIRAPNYELDLAEENRKFKEIMTEVRGGEPDETDRLIDRSTLFAIENAEHRFLWDPTEPTDAHTHEYPIYCLARGADGVVREADSMMEFIYQYTTTSYHKFYPYGTRMTRRR
jgi:uncharacterized protein (TIGR02996 family)